MRSAQHATTDRTDSSNQLIGPACAVAKFARFGQKLPVPVPKSGRIGLDRRHYNNWPPAGYCLHSRMFGRYDAMERVFS